jgi:alanine-glyoxylate transaminase / serine-glyoxylate transaminase / serine-pyruvate transaminase
MRYVDIPLQSFRAPQRSLLGPGPSEIDPRVAAAMAQGSIGYLDPAFVTLMEQVTDLLRYAFQTENHLTFPASGAGTVGMESCFANLVSPGDPVIVCRNGVFGHRMIEIARRCGAEVVVVDDVWGEPVNPEKVKDAFKANPKARLLGFVHAETSTGCQSNAKLLTEIAHQHDALVIVDAVTSLGGTALFTDRWGLDVVYSASQKCLSCTPGLSPISFSDRALDHVRRRNQPVQSWFMDVGLVIDYWCNTQRSYHFTAPTQSLYGLHEALRLLRQETLEEAWKRHACHSRALKAGLDALGFVFVVAESAQLPQLLSVYVPHGINEAEVRRTLLLEFNLEIGAGLGPLAGKIWRFGLMGYSCRAENVRRCISALGIVMQRMGYSVPVEIALEAVDQVYALHQGEAAEHHAGLGAVA